MPDRPSQTVCDQFALRLRLAMEKKGLSQHEVAGRVWGKTKDRRGYYVAKNRAQLRSYISAQSYPTLPTLQKLADAIGTTVDDLTAEPARPALPPPPWAPEPPEPPEEKAEPPPPEILPITLSPLPNGDWLVRFLQGELILPDERDAMAFVRLLKKARVKP
jgi:transcriptional regulator with XRE-family HTH domain